MAVVLLTSVYLRFCAVFGIGTHSESPQVWLAVLPLPAWKVYPSVMSIWLTTHVGIVASVCQVGKDQCP